MPLDGEDHSRGITWRGQRNKAHHIGSSRFSSMVSLQNISQSATVLELRQYSRLIRRAGSQRTMSYGRSTTSRKVRLLRWNHEPCFMDPNSEHLTPATFFRHRHLNVSGILGSADHVISRLQVLHSTSLQIRATSLRNCIAMP